MGPMQSSESFKQNILAEGRRESQKASKCDKDLTCHFWLEDQGGACGKLERKICSANNGELERGPLP